MSKYDVLIDIARMDCMKKCIFAIKIGEYASHMIQSLIMFERNAQQIIETAYQATLKECNGNTKNNSNIM